MQHSCFRLMSSPKALIPCVPQVFFFASNIMLRAAWMSRSSLYPQGHSYTLSANVISFLSFPHTGQYFVVGSLDDSTVTRSLFISFAFTIPNTECWTVRPTSLYAIRKYFRPAYTLFHALKAHAQFYSLYLFYGSLIFDMLSVTTS